MPTFRRSRTLHAGEDRVFEYLAKVDNLPKYFDQMTSAKPAGGDRVDVVAEVHGEKEEGEAWFRVDRTARRIQWGAPGSDYSGVLDIKADQDRTIVDIELHTAQPHASDDEIDQALDATLDHIRDQVEADNAQKGTVSDT
ncbi:SRPBCC family protein [Kibdelosporangium persicum]|uniref:Polyketide cyclase/dehydrase/lipid transport protein n=1 Tax=Kibdelosporangium persicum TaxID=2698649 RepID=A0ABX2EVH8_9PSEU|nr:SRPBCC family protein [Kibdelosporangium persicum]NRN62977.1 Polyketide cyclase/dehydrase/lipid transport protein [Kibdelosporangium persicum]